MAGGREGGRESGQAGWEGGRRAREGGEGWFLSVLRCVVIYWLTGGGFILM